MKKSISYVQKLQIIINLLQKTEEDSDSMDSPRRRGLWNVASMTNLEHGSADDMRFSNHNLASSTPTKSGSLLSLGRSFIGDLFNKSV